MILHTHESLGDAPPGYWRHLAATWRQNLLLALFGALGAGIAWWTDSHRLVQILFSTMSGTGFLQFAIGRCVIFGRSHRFRGGGDP